MPSSPRTFSSRRRRSPRPGSAGRSSPPISMRSEGLSEMLRGTTDGKEEHVVFLGRCGAGFNSILRELERLDRKIEGLTALCREILEVATPPSPRGLAYLEVTAMAVTTTINLTAGGTSDQINVENPATGMALDPSTITWSSPVGEAGASDLTITPSADGAGFFFTADPAAPTESPTVFATWNDPAGVAPAVIGPVLTMNITTAAAAPPTALQYNEVSGS